VATVAIGAPLTGRIVAAAALAAGGGLAVLAAAGTGPATAGRTLDALDAAASAGFLPGRTARAARRGSRRGTAASTPTCTATHSAAAAGTTTGAAARAATGRTGTAARTCSGTRAAAGTTTRTAAAAAGAALREGCGRAGHDDHGRDRIREEPLHDVVSHPRGRRRPSRRPIPAQPAPQRASPGKRSAVFRPMPAAERADERAGWWPEQGDGRGPGRVS
ncbi:MAG TPA: hypothetical protein VF641_01260, partial [Methylobacterium sp.]